MTKIEIYLVLVGVVVCSALTYCLAGVWFPDHGGDREVVVQSALPAPARPQRQETAVQDKHDAPDSTAAVASNPVPADATVVSDQSLLRLSGMVNIANAVNAGPDKEEWRQALPVAEKLLACPCDCAQRNWLKHFVEMGDNALHGSEQEYHESAQIMVTLGRNNDQAVAISKPAN